MTRLANLTIVWLSVAASMTACKSDRIEPIKKQDSVAPAVASVAPSPQGAELRRLAKHPNVAIVLARISATYTKPRSFLRDERQKVHFEIIRVTWVGSRLPSIPSGLKKGFTGPWGAYNRGGRKFSDFFKTKKFPLDSFRVGGTYWLVITSGLSTGHHIVTWEEVGPQPHPSKDR